MRRIKWEVPCYAAMLGAALILWPACSVNVKKNAKGEEKQVDVRTPVGAIHVSKGADPQDVGIAVYPGAKLREKDDKGEDKSANVNISGFGFGIRVVALEYETDDGPAKVVDYYKDQLQKYGKVLVCHTDRTDVNPEFNNHDKESDELKCEGSTGVNIELKVGTKENQHVVAVEPQGSGSKFTLVYVRAHGKDADI